MIKKFTLLLLLAFVAIETIATNRQTVVYQNQFQTSHWENRFTLDKSLFSDLQTGDVLWVLAAKDESTINYKDEGKDVATDHNWYQLSVSIPTLWTTIVNSADMAYVPYYSVILTEEQVLNIKAYGLDFFGHCVYVKTVAFGSPFNQTSVEHWDGSKWSTDGFEMSDWSSETLNTSGQLANAKIGDRITVNYSNTTDVGDDQWGTRVALINASNGWATVFDYPAGLSTSVSFPITADNYSNFKNGDIRISGINCTVTSIQLETTSLYYRLSAYDNNVELEKVPTQHAVNIDLYRKFDWNTTICVPFNIADVAITFGNSAKAYTLNRLENDELIFDETNYIEAGKPYLMTFDMTSVEEVDKTMTKTIEGVTINTTLTNESASEVSFKGNYTTGFGMLGKYGVACKQHGENWDWGFYKGGSSSTLPAFSAYIESNVAPSRGFSISFDGGTTNIKSSISDEEDNGEIYNLMGVKTNATHKGIYIKNGKKYIAK